MTPKFNLAIIGSESSSKTAVSKTVKDVKAVSIMIVLIKHSLMEAMPGRSEDILMNAVQFRKRFNMLTLDYCDGCIASIV